MNTKIQIKPMMAALTLVGSLLNTMAQPTAFTYQGRLNDNLTGNPVPDGLYDINCTNYDGVLPGGNVVASYNVSAVGVTNGLFSVAVDFGPGVFTGPDRWLELSVRTNGVGLFMTQSPRQKFLSAPYAIFANTATNLAGTLPATQLTGTLPTEVLVGADGSGLTDLDASDLASGTVPDNRLGANVARTGQVWLLGGNAGTTPGSQFLGTTDDKALEFKVHASRAFRIEPNTNSPNIIGGYSSNVVEGGTSAAIIGGGGRAGAINRISTGSSSSTISGGSGNVIRTNSPFAAIAGGVNNTIGGDIINGGASIGGGNLNEILAYSTSGTIGGGAYNTLTNAPYATIAGGAENEADAWDAAIGGGAWNRVWHSADHATISGGYANTVKSNAESAVISGGLLNLVEMNAFGANIGGGATNSVMGSSVAATIGGGVFNQIRTNAGYGTIGGGSGNIIEPHAFYGTIGGGFGNTIQPFASYATVAGGLSNSANSYGFAAGRRAKANHEGAFVWADSSNADFASTTNNQFLIRASGGVGIGTNNPQAQMHVAGRGTNALGRLQNADDQNASLALATEFHTWRIGQNRPPDDTGKVDGFFIHDEDANQTRLYINTSGNVGIGTNAPAGRLDVNGTAFLRGNISVSDAATMNFGSAKRQMLNLYSTAYGLGVQDFTMYFRSNERFSWYRDGVHSDTENSAGAGGTVLMTLTGSSLIVNGTFVSASDRNAKEDFHPVDARAILDKVAALPLSEWNYKADEEHSRHLGPMAQDFKAAFNLGPDDKHIATVDADGVALAAIQGLNEIVKEKDAKIGGLENRLTELEQIVRKLSLKGE